MSNIGASQFAAEQITGLLTKAGIPITGATIPPGYVTVAASLTDDKAIALPNNAAALLNGRAFYGISTGFNASTDTDNAVPCQRDGIAKAMLKTDTPCVAEQPCGYDPADGGVVVPYTNQAQVLIGKFTQTKAALSGGQLVGVELLPGAAGAQGGGVLLYAAPQAGTASSMAENAYSNATLTLPANFLRVGDVLEFGAGLITSAAHSTDTVILRWKIGSTAIVTSTTLNATVGDVYSVRGSVTISAITASGTANGEGTMTYGQPATDGVVVPGCVAASIDTTAAITLTLTEQWSVSDAGNLLDLKSAWYRLSRKSA